MTPLTFDNKGHLVMSPAPESSSRDFDFLTGSWEIRNRKLASRLSGSTQWNEFEATGTCNGILLGIGNIDDFVTTIEDKPFEGMTMRLFNPKTKLWSIYWADSNNGTLDKPVVGSFSNATGYFYNEDVFNGKEIIVVFEWDKSDTDNPVWRQAFSIDKGRTWEWNWYMYFKRKK
ncbi:MAG: hypothetical protein ABI581_14940 [Sediminibacterium sp.]